MAKYKSGAKVDFTVNMNMNESEARALEAITGYEVDDFLKFFYAHLGKHYLEPHEDGLRELFTTIRDEIPKHLKRVDAAYNAFK